MLKTILVIDDSEFDQEFTLHALLSCNIDNPVTFARDGGEALSILKSIDPMATGGGLAMIFLDINLPLLNGFELLKYARSFEHFAEIPIIVQTTSVLSQDRLRAQVLGASGFVTKNVDINTYVEDLCLAVAPFRSFL